MKTTKAGDVLLEGWGGGGTTLNRMSGKASETVTSELTPSDKKG